MNADLEETLVELGPGYREMVMKMRRYGDINIVPDASRLAQRKASWLRPFAYATAASIAIAVGISAFFMGGLSTVDNRHPATNNSQISTLNSQLPTSIYTLAYAGEAAAKELVRTQKMDGSWDNDFLTRQNAAALRRVAGASVAYRKALRYLRSRGLSPLSDAELLSRAQLARNR